MHDATKILSPDQAECVLKSARGGDEVVVHCHGCFDIVHPGHVRHLKEARRFGDRLMVSITGDASINKGDNRPLIPQELRAENLAALDCVDWVVINPAPTAISLLKRLRPDVYVKGREYEHNDDAGSRAEREIVQAYGGRVVFTSGDVVFSSTALISAMEDTAAPFQAQLRRVMAEQDLDPRAVEPVLGAFGGRRVLVVGETIIDSYVLCDRPQVSGDSPIMTLRPIEQRSFDGGAAIIARHLAAMGARPILVTALPRQPEAEALRLRLAEEGVEIRWLEHQRPMLRKQRFMVGSNKVVKLDLGEPLTLDAAQQRELIGLVVTGARESEAVIIGDYGEGLFSSTLMSRLCRAVRPKIDLLVGDVSGRRSNLMAFTEMDLICPTELELREALHRYDEGLTSVVWAALERTNSRAAIITLAEEGLIAFDCRKDAHRDYEHWRNRLRAAHVPSFAPHAVDPLGCGDALLAAATMTLASGGSLVLASVLGTVAAAAQAQRLGNAVIGRSDLRRGLVRLRDAQLALATDSPARAVVDTCAELRHTHA